MERRPPVPVPSRILSLAATVIIALAPVAACAQQEARQARSEPVTAQKKEAAAENFQPYSGQAGKDVIWVPTPDDIVEAMLDLAGVKAGETLVDLGSGDGKIAIAAARRGANARGIEYNPDMVGLSERNAARAGVTNVRFINGDIFASDFSDADVVTMYLLPSLNQRLRPTLLAMKPGTRIASHQFTMGDWEPDDKRTIDYRDALFWVVPAKIGGTWSINSEAGPKGLGVAFAQTYQKLSGRAAATGQSATLRMPEVRGATVRFNIVDADNRIWRYRAEADHNGNMKGQVTGPAGQVAPFTASRSSLTDTL